MCQHEEIWFNSGDYYVTCMQCHARWGRLSNDGRKEYSEVNGIKIGCAPEEANVGYREGPAKRVLVAR